MIRVLILSAVAGLVGGAAASAILRWLFPLNQLETIMTKLTEDVAANAAKTDAILAEVQAARQRVDARDALLTQAQSARDAAVAAIGAVQAENDELKAKLAASEPDTAAEEASLEASNAKLDSALEALRGMELTPPADPAPAPAEPIPEATVTQQ